MQGKAFIHLILAVGILSVFTFNPMAYAISEAFKENIYNLGALKPVDSVLKVKVGTQAPDFTLSAVSGGPARDFRPTVRWRGFNMLWDEFRLRIRSTSAAAPLGSILNSSAKFLTIAGNVPITGFPNH